ncbi:MAG: hypothetical protein IT162_14065 [Bryobacterales bacterium]|nr:hypothetical protein [Bryobacterales bacterium]
MNSKFWRSRAYWQAALPELYDSYRGLCAFTGTRIERVVGARTVEHFKPKSKYPESAYDWANFRLVCGLMNGRKGDHEDVIDPFKLPSGVFTVNFVDGSVSIRRDCKKGWRAPAQRTIERLQLDDLECRTLRKNHALKILSGAWSLSEAEETSPFVFSCLRDQGLVP